MPEPHDLHQPTAQMPVVEPRGVYRAADHRRTALIAAGSAVVLLALVVWLFTGDDDPAPAAPVAAPTPSSAPAEVPSEAAESSPPETEPEPEAAPTTAPPDRPAQPAELITGLAAVIGVLEDEGELDDDVADALTRRLEQAADRLERGKAKEAARKIKEFEDKLRDLRKDDELSADAFGLLREGAEQIRAVLPRG
ncbi:hypothetical protein Ait01nite_021480 [Actinoplanes italicus]|uniref:FIMAH domain-containing protein n=1 Tax=Actinoplanes italicus TaxID=113567 RepID=UPI0011B22106|nr:hypothetical protein [Actinoplanes italicus]GIE29103.1 hypothetical protein Ait01nite_021480 [Actinoplanes italicus]